jgi:hypothetical protein
MVFGCPPAKGAYVVRNVSAGGVLLTGGPLLPVGGRVRVLLRLVGHRDLQLSGRVLRQDIWCCGSSLAIAFRDVAAEVQDAIQEAVVAALARERDPSGLVVNSHIGSLAQLASDLNVLGRRPLLAATALDTICWLADPTVRIEVALVERFLPFGEGQDVLRIVARERPSARRILVSPSPEPTEASGRVHRPSSYTIVHRPFDRARLASVLDAAPDPVQACGTDSDEGPTADTWVTLSQAPGIC